MVGDHFQHQCADFIPVAHQREQQPVGVIQLRPVELAVAQIGELLDLGSTEVVASDGRGHLVVAGFDA